MLFENTSVFAPKNPTTLVVGVVRLFLYMKMVAPQRNVIGP